MHEVATSQSLADAVLSEAKKRNAGRVIRVEVEIGELSFLEPEQVEFWVERCFEGTVAEGAKIAIDLIQPVVECEDCGRTGPIKLTEHPAYHLQLPVFQCPACSSSNVQVKQGRSCTLRRVEMEIPGRE